MDAEDVDVYLPQLLTMYIYMHDVAEALHPYLVYRYYACRNLIERSAEDGSIHYAVTVYSINYN